MVGRVKVGLLSFEFLVWCFEGFSGVFRFDEELLGWVLGAGFLFCSWGVYNIELGVRVVVVLELIVWIEIGFECFCIFVIMFVKYVINSSYEN